MRRWITILLSICLISTSLILFNEIADPVKGATFYVGSDQTYPTIQSAINAASSGDTIRIYDGTYYEEINVNRSLTIIGNSSSTTAIIGSGSNFVIEITSSNVSISGLSILKTNSVRDKGGINSNGFSNISIQDCILSVNSDFNVSTEGLYYGINIRSSNSGIIRNVSIQNSTWGVQLHSSENYHIENVSGYNNGVTIRPVASSWTTISNSFFELCQNSIVASFSNNITIANNSIINCGYSFHTNIIGGSGISIPYSHNMSMINNSFTNCGITLIGVNTSQYNSHLISNNTVNNKDLLYLIDTNNKTVSGDYGEIFIINSTNIRISNQNFSNSTKGISSFYSSGLTVENVTSNWNQQGFDIKDIKGTNDGSEIRNSSFSYSYQTGIKYIGYDEYNIAFINNTCNNNQWYGIMIEGVSNITLINNSCSGNSRMGTIIEAPYNRINNHLLVSNCIFNNNIQDGLSIEDTINIEINNNSIINNNIDGIILQNSDYRNIENNSIMNNSGDGMEILNSYYTKNKSIKFNNISYNEKNGLLINNKFNNIINNTFIKNKGLAILIKSNNNTVHHNYFKNNNNNNPQCIDNGSMNLWNNSLFGNYWMNYLSPDSNNDGIVDIPYDVSGTARSKDHYPLIPDHLILKGPMNTSAYEDSLYYEKFIVYNYDSSMNWTINTNASWLNTTGSPNVSGTPLNDDVGSYWVNATINYESNQVSWTNITLTVINTNDEPIINHVPRVKVFEDSPFFDQFTAIDVDPVFVLKWNLQTNSTFMSIDETTGNLTGVANNSGIGTYWVNVTVTDEHGAYDWINYTLEVNNTNDDPVISSSNVVTATEDSLYNVTYTATDEDPTSDTLSWTVTTNASFLSMDVVNGWLRGTPIDRDIGLWWVNVSVSDGNGGIDWSNFTLRVTNINDVPVISNEPWKNATEDSDYYFQMEFSDDDPSSIGEIHTWSLINAPLWLSITSTGSLYGTPGNDDVGLHSFTIIVDDGTTKGSLDFSITVENVNDDPLIDPFDPMLYANEDEPFYYDLEASDIDPTSDTFTWTLMDYPDWLSIDSMTGELSGTPTNAQVGVWSVNVSLFDGNGGVDIVWFNITVRNTNDDPIINPLTLGDALEDQPWHYILTVFDMDPTNDEMYWSIDETNADFLSIDPSTGNLSGIPDNDDVGEWYIIINVSDGNGGWDILNVTMEVLNVNDDPVITTNIMSNAIEDEEYWIILEAYDIDPTDDLLTWSIDETNSDFFSIGPSTGNLSGIPENDDVGEWYIIINVSDGNGGWDVLNITMQVTNVNDDPVISTTTLSEGIEDENYWFIIAAYDIDPTNDALIWSIDETDATFLTIDPQTGNLSGVPGNDDVGNWFILINASDGNGGYAFVNFTIEIIGVNDAPEFNQTITTLIGMEDEGIVIDLNDVFIDIEGDPLSFTFSISENFTFSLVDGVVTIIPDPDWSGEEVITISASDGKLSTPLNVTIQVDSVNDPPSNALIDALSTYREGENQTISATVDDPDLDYGDSLTFTWSSNITGHIGIGDTINLSLPFGRHLIILNVTDSSGDFTIATVEIEILPKEDDQTSSPSDGFPWWVLALIALVLILIAVIILFIFKRRKSEETPAEAPVEIDDVYPQEEYLGDTIEADPSVDLYEGIEYQQQPPEIEEQPPLEDSYQNIEPSQEEILEIESPDTIQEEPEMENNGQMENPPEFNENIDDTIY